MRSLHSYSTDITRRKKVIFILAIVSFGVILVTEFIFRLLPPPFFFGFGIGGLSVFLVFQAIYLAFNTYIWDHSITRWLKLSKVPNIKGEWKGKIVSSHKDSGTGQQVEIEGRLEIRQNWRDILIEWHGEGSDSYSVAGTILVSKGGWPTVNYQYKNVTRDGTPTSQNDHDGTAELRYIVQEDEEYLRGYYYTNREPQTQGEMHFTRS